MKNIIKFFINCYEKYSLLKYCGYARLKKGKLLCASPARLSNDKNCYPKECLGL